MSLFLSHEVSNLLHVDIGLTNYYYFTGAVLGSLIPDLDHHSSVVNRRLLVLLEIALKIIIAGIAYKLLSSYASYEPLINIALSLSVLLALSRFNFKKKWSLKLLYILFALLLLTHYGVSVKSLVAAITLICTGYFPHRGYTHKWYGMGMIIVSLYLYFGVSGFFVGCVLGMGSHVLSDGLKSKLHF